MMMARIPSQHRFALSLVAFYVALLFIPTYARNLVQLAVLHRHGARTEPFVSDHGLNWDECVLSESGVVMALSLGRFTKTRYGDFLPQNYSDRTVVSVSTDFERTIRTGFGFLRGIYNGVNDIPYLQHKPSNKDFLLGYYYSWPSAVIGTPYIELYDTDNNAITLTYFPQSDLNVIGNQLGCPVLCSENQTLCALLGEDVSTCRLSNGGLSPELAALFPLMFEAQERSNAFLYLYNESDEYWRHTGPYGRLLAVEIIDAFNATLTQLIGNGTQPEAKLLHYSAHDVTIYSYFVAIGAIVQSTTAIPILVPTFASATFLELFDDGNVSVSFFECNQTFGSGFPFSEVDDVWIGCKRSAVSAIDNDDVYFAKECPLEHFRNYVNLKAPQFNNHSTMGSDLEPWCYADPADVATTNCWPNSTDTPTVFCKQYREICPQFSCDLDLGLVLDRTTYTCVQMFDPSSSQSSSSGSAWANSMNRNAGWYVGIVISSICIGIVVGATIRFFILERQSKADASYRLLAESNAGTSRV